MEKAFLKLHETSSSFESFYVTRAGRVHVFKSLKNIYHGSL